MRTKTLLSISAFIGTLYALGFLIAPEVLARIYGIDATPGTILEVRFFGQPYLALASSSGFFATSLIAPSFVAS